MNQKFMKMIAAFAAIPIAAASFSFPTVNAEMTAVMTPATELAGASAVLIDITAADFTEIRVSDYRSNWNTLVQTGLWYCTPAACDMDAQAVYDTVIANAGSYAPFFEAVFAGVSEETLSYAENVFLITAQIPKLGDVLADENGMTLTAQTQALAAEYGIPLDPQGVLDIACTAEIRCDFSNVGASGIVGLSYAFRTEDGTFTLLGENGLFGYLAEKLDTYAAYVEASVSAEDTAFTEAFHALLDTYRSRSNAELAVSGISERAVTVSGTSLNDVLTQIELRYPDYADRIPASAETVAVLLEQSWNSLMTQINANFVPEGGALQLDLHEVAAILDSLTNVTVTMNQGVAYISGTLTDTQSDAVKAYYAENPAALAVLAAAAQEAGDAELTGLAAYAEGMTLEDTAKAVEISLPLTILEDGCGDIYYNVYRTYAFSAPEVTETTPAETTTEMTETTETSEETTTETTETTETSEETTTEMTETTETSEETTTEMTETTETSEETTTEMTETTATSEETTTETTETTEASEETTTEMTETTETSEETTTETTETTETSEETTTEMTETTKTSEETTTEMTETTETSEETTTEMTETTETSEETTTEMTETTATSEETTTETTSTTIETETTETTKPNKPELIKPEKPEGGSCDKHHHHHLHEDHKPELIKPEKPEGEPCDKHHHHHPHEDHKPELIKPEKPEGELCDKHHHDHKPHEVLTPDPTKHPVCPAPPELPEKPDCAKKPHHGNAGRQEQFQQFQKNFAHFNGMKFDGGMPRISLKR